MTLDMIDLGMSLTTAYTNRKFRRRPASLSHDPHFESPKLRRPSHLVEEMPA